MRRVRIVLALLVLALAVPVTLIVSRALEAIEFERRARHAAVADRVFDEMERTLSEFLAREEARPPDDYAFYSRLADEGATGDRVRSPLSRPSDESFVLAHFQVDPGGALLTPLRPDDEAQARRYGDWPPEESDRARVELGIDLIEERVTPFWQTAIALHALEDSAEDETRSEVLLLEQEALARADASGSGRPSVRLSMAKPRPSSVAQRSQGPTSAPVQGEAAQKSEWRDARDADEAPARSKKAATAYDVIDSLNLGARQRESRKQRVAEVKPSQTFAKRDIAEKMKVPADAEGSFERELPTPRAQLGVASESLEESYTGWERSRYHDALGGLIAAEPDDAAAPLADTPLRVILHPMAGAALGGDLLMLYRTVSVDGAGYRQGVLLDRASLGLHLEQQVISVLPTYDAMRLQFDDERAAGAPADWYLAEHRFAEPFDGLDIRLALAPLAGTAGAAPLYALAALLAAVALVGVLSVHRMVAVVVDFAERRSNFVASVSHELKTPLTSIRMYAEMLRDGLIGETTKREEYYRTIHDESERLSRLIDNVLEFSRLEKGSRVFNLSVGSVGETVEEIAARLRPHAEGEGFTLRVEVEPELPPVRFDHDALVQIVFNLVDNALKYAKGCERSEVVLRCTRADAGGVVVSVRDFGPGVPRQHLTQVFEPFYRAEPELTRSARGSGIGLALVKELGEAMGAAVSGCNPDEGGFRVDVAFQPQAAPA